MPLRAALYVDEFPIPLDKIRNHFAVASRVRVVADLTARNTLAEAAKQLEEYALFAASHKFKKDLNCKLLPDKILVELGAYFTAMEKWFGEIGEPRQREVIKMKEGIQAAIQGDREMRQFWRVDDLRSYLIKRLRATPTLSYLQSTYFTCVTLVAAANKCGDIFLENIAKTTILYVKWFAKEAHANQTVKVPTTSTEVCETIEVELESISAFLTEHQLTMLDWSHRRHGAIADAIEDGLTDSDSGSDFVPPTDNGSSSEEEELRKKEHRVNAKWRQLNTNPPIALVSP